MTGSFGMYWDTSGGTEASDKVTRTVRWVKGHGTENDFLLLRDPDGTTYRDLDAAAVRAMCERRRGVGADGVLRAVRTDAIDDGRAYAEVAEWFMDFRNADGSTGEMCGNGARVFAAFLYAEGLADPGTELPVATRAGLKRIRVEGDGQLTVDMGIARFPASDGLEVSAAGHTWSATAVDMGNPHGVAFVDDLADPGPLLDPPTWSPSEVFPKGVNLEFALRRGARHLAMRVHERGVGETRSCGTGACAVAVTTARVDGVDPPATYRVDVPGGTLAVGLHSDGHVELTGPAVLVARGEVDV
ncbi:diaminopimelate epimerase [Actinopolymorpha sp. B9G3]|uniref:diaminopimelate epimerase n=1 Tax=Actinopolymorpha sp. B9G3 TaxID=3158970 RepID=UPI0032D8BE5B